MQMLLEYFANLESIKLIDYENMINSITETVKRKFDAFKELLNIGLKGCVLNEENSVYNEYFYEHYMPKLVHCQKELLDYIDDCNYIKIKLRNKLWKRIDIEQSSIGLYNIKSSIGSDKIYYEFDICFKKMYETRSLYIIENEIKSIYIEKLNPILIKKKIHDIINSE